MIKKYLSWEAALHACKERYQQNQTPGLRRLLANVYSLSGLYFMDFSSGLHNGIEAIALEPLNPLHRYRLALLYMRFGQWQEASQILQSLTEQLPNLILPQYLRGLIFLRLNETKRAVNLATEITLKDPQFTWARFLLADAYLRQTMKRSRKYLNDLPRGEVYSALWVDLLIKLIVADPNEGPKFVETFQKTSRVLPTGSREEALVQQVISWNSASAEAMGENLVKLTPGSKAEQVALLFFYHRLKKGPDTQAYLAEIKRLYDLLPQRTAVRRFYVAALNRYTVEEAAEGRYKSALVTVEICLRLEPYNTIHYQNRATLFTLLREREPYHHAWEELDRHQYRLALLGRLDQENARAIAKRHRMFAQQARLTPGISHSYSPNAGIFRAEQRIRNELAETILIVNQERIDADPELLRQWIHHHKAELLFSHLALGVEPDRFLLGYADEISAKVKLESLIKLSDSLAILAGEEGHLLATSIDQMWRQLHERACPTYAKPEGDAEIQFLKQSHIETLGDIALLCYHWEPHERDGAVADELIEFLKLEAAFLDEETLLASLKQQDRPNNNLAFLSQILAETLHLTDKKRELSHVDRVKVTNRMASHLLLNLSLDVYKESSSKPKEAAHRALRILERARQVAADDPVIEYFSARFFLIGDFYEESRQAISRFYRLNKDPTSPYASEIEEILKALDEADQERERKYLSEASDNQISTKNSSVAARIQELKATLERFPSSIQAYEDLAYLLVAEGAFDEALEQTEQAIAHCLSRRGQLRARMLNLEMLGVKTLGQSHLNEIRLYVVGAYFPLRNTLALLCKEEVSPYSLHYLLGICWLAEGEPEQAQASFQYALGHCDRQLHFVTLRSLASNVEQALYDMAKQSIEHAMKEQQYKDAFEHVTRIMKKLRQPEVCLMDLANIHLAALLAKIQVNLEVPQIPQITLMTPWNDRLAMAIQSSDDLERTQQLVHLAIELDPSSKRRGEEILIQLDELQTQAKIASTLSHSTKLAQEGKLEDALALLLSVGTTADTEPRILRQRAMLLLRLERFSEADDIVDRLKTMEDPIAVSFVDTYPSLKFRHQIREVQALLRKGKLEAARECLDTIEMASDEARLEIVYCRAFSLAIEGYRWMTSGANGQAVAFFEDALDLIEPEAKNAEQSGHIPLLDLYNKLAKDLDDLQETMNEPI